MKLKSIVSKVFFLGVLLVIFSCREEGIVQPQWTYAGPNPAITDGPSEAQRLCYALYKKYDLHPYFNLSADEALKTGVGQTQVNFIILNNSAAMPMQAASEQVAEQFFTLLTRVYALFPEELIKRTIHKRQVLVKINPARNNFKNELNVPYFTNTYTEDGQGIIYYGYLNNNTDLDNKLDSKLQEWKFGIVYELFRGLSDGYYKKAIIPIRFSEISKAYYYYDVVDDEGVSLSSSGVFDRKRGYLFGLVHPLGVYSSSLETSPDWGSIIAWILTTSLDNRTPILKASPRLNEKYNIIMNTCKIEFNIDLELLSPELIKITTR